MDSLLTIYKYWFIKCNTFVFIALEVSYSGAYMQDTSEFPVLLFAFSYKSQVFL